MTREVEAGGAGGAPPANVRRAILVTGSGSGIGAATVRRLAGPGVGLLVHARGNRDGCELVAAEARGAGAEAVVALGDLGGEGVPESLVGLAERSFGRLDVLVANAGFAFKRPFAALERADLARANEVMMAGFLVMAKAALPLLKRSGSGRIVVVSSFTAHLFGGPFPAFPASSAAKAGVEGLARALAVEVAAERITVNCVAPGLIRKDEAASTVSDEERRAMREAIPLGRLGEPDEVAAVIAFLAAAETSYMTGQVLHVDGGLV